MLENVHYCHSVYVVGGALRQTSRSSERVYRIRNEIIQCSCREIEVLGEKFAEWSDKKNWTNQCQVEENKMRRKVIAC